MNSSRKQWDVFKSTVKMTRCKECNKIEPCDLLVDPYLAELEPDANNPQLYWCKDCWHNRAVEI